MLNALKLLFAGNGSRATILELDYLLEEISEERARLRRMAEESQEAVADAGQFIKKTLPPGEEKNHD